MGLMDDVELLAFKIPTPDARMAAVTRLRAFIEQHEPWYPPQQGGFGPWIEYKPGDKGPRVGEVVFILTARDRDEKTCRGEIATGLAGRFCWLARRDGAEIVAYCVKLEEAQS